MPEWLTEILRTAAGVLPWWQGLLLILAVSVLVVLLRKAGTVLPKEPPPDPLDHKSPPIPVQPDGTIHLDQKPPEGYT